MTEPADRPTPNGSLSSDDWVFPTVSVATKKSREIVVSCVEISRNNDRTHERALAWENWTKRRLNAWNPNKMVIGLVYSSSSETALSKEYWDYQIKSSNCNFQLHFIALEEDFTEDF